MIADIFKEVYKGQQANAESTHGRQRRRAVPEQKIPRAEPVEEDESD